jgi:inorganic pyrophosphatase
VYPLNYGFVPGVRGGDGQDLDAYVLGVFEPLTEFRGRCLAVIRRTNDNDDKLVLAPDGSAHYSDAQIRALTEFRSGSSRRLSCGPLRAMSNGGSVAARLMVTSPTTG